MSDYLPLTSARNNHTISELCKICGVTRRMILNYEDHGLITPVDINESSGYRYYGATSAARICHIKALQTYGLSLNNIARFLNNDSSVIQEHLTNLEAQRTAIDEQISRTKVLLTKPGDDTIHREKLPAGNYVMMTEPAKDSQHNFWLLWRLTSYVFAKGWRINLKGGSLIRINYFDPKDEYYGMVSAAWSLHTPNEETVYFPATEALCITVKGPYDRLPHAVEMLFAYAKEHGIAHEGRIRFSFPVSPQSHADPEQYITCVHLPIL